MYLRPNHREKDGKDHTYWSLVETVRTPDGPRQRTLCYLGELNSSAQARWLKTVEVFNAQGEREQLKLFPSDVEPPPDDPHVARVLIPKVRLERMRQFGACYLGLQLWKRLELDRFWGRSGGSRSGRGALVASGRRPGDQPAVRPGAANWPLRNAGIPPRHWMICWASKRSRSTTPACIAVWIASCRTRHGWSST
jgi:hypothetical protein